MQIILLSSHGFQVVKKCGSNLLAKILIALFFFGLSGGNLYSGCPGGQLTVAANATIPAGWIKIARSSNGQYVTIRDISCETLNWTETMILESPLPGGWVRTSQQIEAATGYPIYTITCIKGAPFLDQRYVLANFPIPTNWVATSTTPGYNFIKCLSGAPYLDVETMLSWSTYPTAWVLLSESNGYMTRQNLNKVTASISNPVNDIIVASGSNVAFTGVATDSATGAILNYSWNFGDGHTATGNTASHVFTNSGTTNAIYTVTLLASDQNGYFDTATRMVTVNPVPPPPIVVTISPANVTLNPGGTVKFTVSISGTSDGRISWNVTGGSIDAKGNYIAESDPGGYSVTVTSIADSSKDATAWVTVKPVIKPPPEPIEP